MLRTLLLPVVVSAMFVPPLAAQTYRWVDDSGKVIYSQLPPPDERQVQTIKPPPPPPEGEAERARQRIQQQNQAFEERRKAKREAAEEAAAKQKKLAEDQRYCQKARENIEMMETRPPNTLFRMPSGEYKRFTTEEWQATLNKSKKYYAENCR